MSELTLSQLVEQQAAIQAQIDTKRAAEKAEAVEKAGKFIALHGLTVNDLFPDAARTIVIAGTAKVSKGTRKPVAPKYVHPTDKSITWGGKGFKPVWVRDHLAKGGTLDELRIKVEQPAPKPVPAAKKAKEAVAKEAVAKK